jgi:uncharacterized protein (DUF1330 family)
MSAFFICLVRAISDREQFGAYRDAVGALVQRYGGRVLGPSPSGEDKTITVAAQFPCLSAAHDFYDSADYAPLERIRIGATRSEVYFLESLPGDGYASP